MNPVTLKDGCLWVATEDGPRILTADDIYSAVFEEADSLHGVKVSSEDLFSTGLEFRRQTADPIIAIRAGTKANGATVDCAFLAKGSGFEGEVSHHGGKFLDYAIDRDTWMPLPIGSADTALSFLRNLGLDGFGPMSLPQYLTVLRTRSVGISVEDRTADFLSASSFADALRGEPPESFEGKLYDYQSAGFAWLDYMIQSDLGAIIADEMGLGKTVQVICVLLKLKARHERPVLLVAPATLLENWNRELGKFAPSLNVLFHRGAARTGFPSELQHYDVVVTSYETAIADISMLRNLTWRLVVIDEAQAIKNPSARRTTSLKTLRRRSAIAMTGTPVQNRLTDLWSITDFVIPSLLGTLSQFESHHPETVSGASLLEPVLSPVILRRRARDVIQDLPPRIDIPQALQLDADSAEVYESIRKSVSSDAARSLTALVKLRMFCSHPWILGQFTHLSTATDCSVKLQRLFEILEEIVSQDGKVLIFTSYQGSADLLSKEITTRFGIDAAVLDGRVSMSDRQKLVDNFTVLKAAGALILNPTVGGTGLNITAANHVIHYNLEWNPAVEDQASARAHRIGQTNLVTVHRLFYVNTVEDIINQRMERKRRLAATAVVGTDGTSLEVQDILAALRVSPLVNERGGSL